MKKVFISVPMKGIKGEDIERSIEKMHELAEMMVGEKLEPVHNFNINLDEIPTECHPSMYCLGEAIKKMSECQYIISPTYTGYFKGCDLEKDIADSYGIKRLTVNIKNCCFLKPAYDIMHKTWNSSNTNDKEETNE